jgi:hypothetical protein
MQPERAGDYDNLLYSCSVCNSCRREEPLPFNPGTEALAIHLNMHSDGAVEGLTSAGRKLCDICHLNRPLLVQFRHSLLELIKLLVHRQGLDEERILQRLLGYPDDMPNLRVKRPPGGNSRPEGISASCYERRKRAELPQVY